MSCLQSIDKLLQLTPAKIPFCFFFRFSFKRSKRFQLENTYIYGCNPSVRGQVQLSSNALNCVKLLSFAENVSIFIVAERSKAVPKFVKYFYKTHKNKLGEVVANHDNTTLT